MTIYPSLLIYPSLEIYPTEKERLITDRTYADVEYAKELKEKIKQGIATTTELKEFLYSAKGIYKPSDLNRVGYALLEAQSMCATMGLIVVFPTTPKTDYDYSSKFTEAEATAYLANVDAIREAITLYVTPPETPTSLANATPEICNTIEMILECVEKLSTKTISMFRYSNDVYAGGQY